MLKIAEINEFPVLDIGTLIVRVTHPGGSSKFRKNPNIMTVISNYNGKKCAKSECNSSKIIIKYHFVI